MASPSTLLSAEHFTCSLCLEVFNNPVSTPCGHSFCVACISSFWAQGDHCLCPKCEKNFLGRPELCDNTFARDMAEQFKRMTASGSDVSIPGPGEVPCDICPGRKLKALKSCLVCLTSYCKTHIEPHQRVATLKRHKLVDPINDLEDRICKKHERSLELFCRNDQVCVCVLCYETDHKTHNTVPVEKEWTERKTKLRKTEAEVQQMIQDRVKKLEEIKESVKLSKVNTEKEIEDGIQVLTNLIQAIQQTQVELIVKLEEKQRIAERRAEGLIKELEKEIIELQRRNTELDQLSNTEDYIHVLQRCSSLCTPPHTMDWSEITVYADLCISTIRAAVTTIENHLNTLEKLLCCNECMKWKFKNARDVTLDPWTANPWLDVSADGKQVKDGDKQQCFPDNPERFDTAPCVLGKEGFSSGRHYWEVEVVGKTAWDLGVARVSVKRKGVVRLSPEDGFWTVCLRRGNEYRACDEQAVLLHLHEKPRKLGVYVDCEEGQVSFYNVDARSHIYTFSGYNFTEKLLPLFNPDMNDDGNNRAPLVISLINHKGGDEFIL
uniref:E3 ubiquitin-protein ligase TRIM39-like n=1 Tax=Scleropages formosus TaxID=113540 RepID=A0A8C9WLU5_SCLFO